jgi:hypothetical protein
MKTVGKILNVTIYIGIVAILLQILGTANASPPPVGWIAIYNGPANDYDHARDIAVDGSGNVYVTGISTGSGTDRDFCTIKYSPSGTQLWSKRYNGPANSIDEAKALALDPSENYIYVTGTTNNSPFDTDYCTIKYSSSGTQVWVRTYDGGLAFHDRSFGIVVDSSGIYITGRSGGDGTGQDIVTIMYDSSGNKIWEDRYNGAQNGWDVGTAITVDSSYVYVTGEIDETPSDSGDFGTIKYKKDGTSREWVRTYNSPNSGGDTAYDILVDPSGNVYVAGVSGNFPDSDQYATVKYDAAGVQKWVKREIASIANINAAISYSSSSGYVYVSTDGTIEFTVAYDPSGAGTKKWLHSNGGLDNTVDSAGNVYVVGFKNWDYHYFKYDQNGNLIWEIIYNGMGNSDDGGNAIALDSSGNVYVTGSATGIGGSRDYVTIMNTPPPPPPNRSPVADTGGPYNGDEGETIQLDGSGTYDPDGDPLLYYWDLDNDGLYDDSTQVNPTYDWGDDGTYIIRLFVYDGEYFDTDMTTVTITNVAPTVDAGVDQTVDEGDIVSFIGSFTDPGWLDTHTIFILYLSLEALQILVGWTRILFSGTSMMEEQLVEL